MIGKMEYAIRYLVFYKISETKEKAKKDAKYIFDGLIKMKNKGIKFPQLSLDFSLEDYNIFYKNALNEEIYKAGCAVLSTITRCDFVTVVFCLNIIQYELNIKSKKTRFLLLAAFFVGALICCIINIFWNILSV